MADLAEVKALIEAALPGAEVEVTDETGGGDHLRATVSAPQFAGRSRIDQHRMGAVRAARRGTAQPGGGEQTERQQEDSQRSRLTFSLDCGDETRLWSN